MRRLNPILMILVFAAMGCASNVDRHWTEAYNAMDSQIANPVAALRNADREVGSMDGVSADYANQKLRQHESDRTGGSILRDVVGTGSGSSN